MKKDKGFTLIELLAIIVILAIIAVITVPIILNVIENAKKGSAIDSAYGYKDAIEKYYVTKLSENSDFVMNGNYTIGDKGKLIGASSEDGEALIHEVSFSGTVPGEGTILIENNVVKRACLVIDEYKIELQDGKFTTSGKGSCGETPDTPNDDATDSDTEDDITFGGDVVTGDDISEGGYTGLKAIVYLDPANLATKCDEAKASANVNENGSPTGINSGCMKWYVFEEDENYYTMLLDHNTTETVAWVSEDDYKQTDNKTATPESVGISYDSEKVTMTSDGTLPAGTWKTNSGGNNRGPITLLKRLQEDTKDWVVAETLTSSDAYTAEWTCKSFIDQSSQCDNNYRGTQKYTINYNGYKARLISGEEIERITGKGTNTVSTIQGGYIDTNCSSGCSAGTNKYGWLFDNTAQKTIIDYTNGATNCEFYGCNVGLDSDPIYWTSSPSSTSSYNSWGMSFTGAFHGDFTLSTVNGGVRPVIKVLKENLKKDDNLQ